MSFAVRTMSIRFGKSVLDNSVASQAYFSLRASLNPRRPRIHSIRFQIHRQKTQHGPEYETAQKTQRQNKNASQFGLYQIFTLGGVYTV